MELNKENIQHLLMREDNVGMNACGRALLILIDRQTFDEVNSKDTKYDNQRGFTPADARILTNLGQFYGRNKYLTPKQLAVVRKPNARGIPRICKYWRQLIEVAKEKKQA